MSDEKDIPAIPRAGLDSTVWQRLEAMREAIQKLIGTRGSNGAAAVRWSDLEADGVGDASRRRVRISERIGEPGTTTIVNNYTTITNTYEPDLTKPPIPTGFGAVGAITSVIATWAAPTYTVGHGHKQTNVYATKQPVTSNTLYTINDAVRIDSAPGALTTLAIASDPNLKWRIWIKWETNDGIESDPAGGVNGVVVSTGQDVTHLLEVLTGQVANSQLAAALSTKIALIDAPNTTAGSVDARIKTEADARVSGDSSTLTSAQSYTASYAYSKAQTDAQISTYAYSKAATDSAIATSTNTVSARLNTGGDVSTAIVSAQTTATAANDKGTYLSGLYSVRTQITQAGRTVIGGFGLMGASAPGAGPTIDFGVSADKFWVGAPAGSSGVPDIMPFVVQTTDQTVNGVLIPKGVYMDAAYIKNLTAMVARLGNAWIDDAKVADISAAKLTAGDGTIGGDLKSSNFVPGSSGWRVRPDGSAEFSFAHIRGTLQAHQVGAKFITASMINSRGLAIEDASGSVIFSANVPIDYSRVGGSSRPADGATAGANLIKKSTFFDGLLGGWSAAGVDNNPAASPHGQFIKVTLRDTIEDNTFAVTAGERMYARADITAWASSHAVSLGLQCLDVNGATVYWLGIVSHPPMTGWLPHSGVATIPAGAVKAKPWIQIDGPGGQTLQECWLSNLYIGRSEPGATVGADWSANLSGRPADSALLNSYAPLGQNLLPNSDQSETCTWVRGYTPNGAVFGHEIQLSRGIWSNTYRLKSGTLNSVAVRQTAAGNISYADNDNIQGKTISADFYFGSVGGDPLSEGSVPVVAGQRYIASVYIAAHRCNARLYMMLMRPDGSVDFFPSSDWIRQNESNTEQLSDFSRISCGGVIPAGFCAVKLFVRKFDNAVSGYDSWLWLAGPQIEAAAPNQQEPSPYQRGPATNTRQLGYAGDLNATHGASWNSNVSGQPSDGAIFNNQIGINASGQFYNVSTGQAGIPVSNNQITIGADGQLQGAGGGQVTIGGLGYLGDLNATKGATFGVDVYGQITLGNISTYIASGAIGSAYIGYAAILTSHIGDLQVDTAKIGNNAVTTAAYASDNGFTRWWTGNLGWSGQRNDDAYSSLSFQAFAGDQILIEATWKTLGSGDLSNSNVDTWGEIRFNGSTVNGTNGTKVKDAVNRPENNNLRKVVVAPYTGTHTVSLVGITVINANNGYCEMAYRDITLSAFLRRK